MKYNRDSLWSLKSLNFNIGSKKKTKEGLEKEGRGEEVQINLRYTSWHSRRLFSHLKTLPTHVTQRRIIGHREKINWLKPLDLQQTEDSSVYVSVKPTF